MDPITDTNLALGGLLYDMAAISGRSPRAMGYKRADYRPLFKEMTTVTKGKARWQKS